MSTASPPIDKRVGPGTEDLGDRPKMRVLNDDKLKKIHEATLTILETIGIKVSHEEAKKIFSGAGCEVDGDVVKIPRSLVEEAISSAPEEITIYDREGRKALHLGSLATYSMTGYTDLDFFDPETNELRPYTLDDIRMVAKVADALPNINIVGHPGVVRPTDEDPLEVINHLEVEAMLTNTTKPLHILVGSGEILQDCFEMAEAVAVANGAASLAEKPFVLPMLTPISPLTLDAETVDKLLVTVDWGIPVICGPMPLAGGTAPITLAGTIAQNMAESLAGLVLSQVRRKGAPHIMITFSEILDMQTGDVYGGPEATLMQISAIEMAHYYGIPTCGSWSGGGYRGVVDVATGWNQMLGVIMGMLAGSNAGICVGTGICIDTCILADELIGMLNALIKGVAVNEETLALDAIKGVSSTNGSFLQHQHTFKHCRDFWQPQLVPRVQGRGLLDEERLSMTKGVKNKLQTILQNSRQTPIPEEARIKIASIIDRARSRAGKRLEIKNGQNIST